MKKQKFIDNNYNINLNSQNKNTIKTTYTYKSESKNFIFYHCNIRIKYNGKGKLTKNSKEFIITELWNKDTEHNNISYDEFVEEFEKKKGMF